MVRSAYPTVFIILIHCHLPSFDNLYPRQKITMNRNNALTILREIKPVLAQQFGITRMALFGSTARDEAGEDSDVDILVGFDGPATSARYFGVPFFLEDQLGCRPVDLVTEKALRAELRPFIEQETINV